MGGAPMRVRISSLAPALAFASLATMAHALPLDVEVSIVNPSPDNNDIFGTGLSISDGKALIGAPGDATTGTNSGRAYVYDTTSGALVATLENPTPASNDQFGGAVSLEGNLALVASQNDALGATGAGAAYVYNATTGALMRTLPDPGPAPTL